MVTEVVEDKQQMAPFIMVLFILSPHHPKAPRDLPSHWLFHIWAARGLGLALVSPCVSLVHRRVEGQDRISPREVGDHEICGLTPMAQRHAGHSLCSKSWL